MKRKTLQERVEELRLDEAKADKRIVSSLKGIIRDTELALEKVNSGEEFNSFALANSIKDYFSLIRKAQE